MAKCGWRAASACLFHWRLARLGQRRARTAAKADQIEALIHANYFARRFHRAFGLTPLAYRASARG